MRCPSLEEISRPPAEKTGWPWTEQSEQLPLLTSSGKPWPTISVVTPSYNQGPFIEETIRSVLLQGYPNLEYIIIDGGSNDDSVEIIKRYERWLTYWVSEADCGQAHALNKGFAKATGEIFSYLNSDDSLTQGTLCQVAPAFANRRKLNLIVSFAGLEYEGRSGIIHLPHNQPNLETWLSSVTSLFQPSTFWSRNLHRVVGGFDEDLQFCFDKDFFLRAVFRFGAYVAQPNWVASWFRVHPRSKTSLIPDLMLAENEEISRRYRADSYFHGILQKQRARRLSRERISAAMITESFLAGLTALVGAVSADPSELRTRFFWGALKKLTAKSLRRSSFT